MRMTHDDAGGHYGEVTHGRRLVVDHGVRYRYDRAGGEGFFLAVARELDVILGSCGESGRYIEVRLGLTYQFGVALVPLVLRLGITSVETLVEERNDVSETLLREPFRITHDEGRILEAVGLLMTAYTIIEHQTNGVVIGFGVLRRVVSAIRDRYGDDHR